MPIELSACLRLSRRQPRHREAALRLAAGRIARAIVHFAESVKDGVDADGCLQSLWGPQRPAS
ncbi:hypothetical protein ABIB00_004082 [Bradyrhizobium sp. LB14.3]